jgi:hypothetical protein
MITFTKTFTQGVSGLLTGLVLTLGVANAAPGGTVAGEIVIGQNTARDIQTGGGKSGSGGILRIFKASGGKGDVKNTETTVQGVSVAAGAQSSADITISGNRAEKIKNDGAHVNVQSVTVR